MPDYFIPLDYKQEKSIDMNKILVILLIAAVLKSATSLPQIEQGSLLGPSGRFQRTKDQAAPPVDLSLPPIYLPEAIPIHEDVKEFNKPPQ